MAAVGYLQIRASATDRDRAVDVLKSAFVDGRLTKQELDQRIGQALGQHYFADLVALIDDLPAGVFARLPAHRATPAVPRTSRLALIPLSGVLAAVRVFLIAAAFLALGRAVRTARAAPVRPRGNGCRLTDRFYVPGPRVAITPRSAKRHVRE